MKKFPLPTIAPLVILGVFFVTSSCQEKRTPDWSEASVVTEIADSDDSKISGVSENETSPRKASKLSAEKNAPNKSAQNPTGDVRFLVYNVENYLTMTRALPGETEPLYSKFKPEKEIAALLEIITHEKPHILGLCEIGTQDELIDLQKRLKEKGLDLPYFEYAHGWDHTRRLGLLSAFPIKSRHSESELFYKLAGKKLQFSRGILDVVITLPGGDTHFIGLHLKSKLEVPRYDQELMRQNEALLARQHCEKIWANDPEARLIVYGDLNDTRRSSTVVTLQGRFRSKQHLEDVRLSDSRGETWTHYWDLQDLYARIDYILVSKNLKNAYNLEKSYVVDSSNWNEASDHRPLLLVIEE